MLLLLGDICLGYLLLLGQLQDVRVGLGILEQYGQRGEFELREVDVLFLAGVKEACADATIVGGLCAHRATYHRQSNCV